MSVSLCVSVCVSSVDSRLYLMSQLLAAVVTNNFYSETEDALNDNKAHSWLCSVADWLLSLKSRFFGFFHCLVSLKTTSLPSVLLLNLPFSDVV